MKVEIDTAAFADAVSWTTRIIPARPAVPVLSGIKISAANGSMQLSAFDYDLSARNQIEAGVDEPGTVVVTGKLLAEIAKMLPAEKTYLSTEEHKLKVVSGKASYSLQLMKEDDYPDLPQIPQKIGQIDGKTFVDSVNQAIIAIARTENRPVLTGVKMTFDGTHVILNATDSYRLTRSEFTWTPEQPDLQASALIRGSLLKDIARAIDTTQNVIIEMDPQNNAIMGFENAGRISTSQLIDSEFPAIDRLFTDDYPIQAVLDRQQLVDAIRRVSLVAERESPIRMEFSEGQVSLSAGNIDESQANEVIEADLDGDPMTVSFNPIYLLDGLTAIAEPFVRMKMKSDARAAVEFNGQQEKDDEPSLAYRYLLVPMLYIG